MQQKNFLKKGILLLQKSTNIFVLFAKTFFQDEKKNERSGVENPGERTISARSRYRLLPAKSRWNLTEHAQIKHSWLHFRGRSGVAWIPGQKLESENTGNTQNFRCVSAFFARFWILQFFASWIHTFVKTGVYTVIITLFVIVQQNKCRNLFAFNLKTGIYILLRVIQFEINSYSS